MPSCDMGLAVMMQVQEEHYATVSFVWHHRTIASLVTISPQFVCLLRHVDMATECCILDMMQAPPAGDATLLDGSLRVKAAQRVLDLLGPHAAEWLQREDAVVGAGHTDDSAGHSFGQSTHLRSN
jgi:hypothetical protein